MQIERETKLKTIDFKATKKIKTFNSKEIKTSPLGIGMEKADGDYYDPSKAYKYLGGLGIKWVRIQSGWNKTELKKGVYDYAWLDDMVDNIIKEGCIPWMCLCYGNSLYDSSILAGTRGVGKPPIYSEEAKIAWDKYVRDIVKHYKGKVGYYEIWNEPDGTHCWVKGVNGKEYGEFALATAKAIKETDKSAKVIAGSMCNLIRLSKFVSSGSTCIKFDKEKNMKNFFEDWISCGAAPYVDFITVHMYRSDVEYKAEEFYGYLRSVLDKYNKKIGIIQGETGVHSRFSTRGALNTADWDEDKQVKYLLRRLITDVANGAYFTSYFTLLDMYEGLSEHGKANLVKENYGAYGVVGVKFNKKGLSTEKYEKKPSYTALSVLSTLVANGVKKLERQFEFCNLSNVYWGGSDIDESDETFGKLLKGYSFKRHDKTLMNIYYVATPILNVNYSGTTTLKLKKAMKRPAIIDTATGGIIEIPKEHIAEDGKLLMLIPLKDYPLAIVDLEGLEFID